MQPETGSRTMRTQGIWLLFAAAFFAVVLVVWMSARKAGGMTAAAASDEQQYAQAAPGTKIKLVIEVVDSMTGGTIRGKILEKKTEKTYLRTKAGITVQSSGETKMVMGKREDVHAGAVVHVTGTVQNDHSIQAEQLVILTGYVQVQ